MAIIFLQFFAQNLPMLLASQVLIGMTYHNSFFLSLVAIIDICNQECQWESFNRLQHTTQSKSHLHRSVVMSQLTSTFAG